MKDKKQRKELRGKGQGKVWPIAVCLLLAGGVFFLLLNVEAKQLAQYEKGNVVVAIADVSEAKEVTEENIAEYFALEERPLKDIPEAAYLELEDLIGQFAQSGIDTGSVITKSKDV